jgi:hypothetical protein
MPNTSKYNSKLLRAEEPAAPAPRDGVIGIVNPYWVEKAASRKQQATSRKRKKA